MVSKKRVDLWNSWSQSRRHPAQRTKTILGITITSVSTDHFHWGKQLLTKSPLGLLVSAEVGQAVRMMFHILKLFGSMSQSWGFCVGRELLLSILKLIFTWTALLQPGKNIDDVMCTGTMSNNKTQCQPCKTGWANYSSFLVLVLVIFAIHAYLIFVTNPTNMFV